MSLRGSRRRAEVGVLVLAASVRLAHLAAKWNHPLRFSDAFYYSQLARQPWEGRWFRELMGNQPSAEHVPLPSLLFALLSWMDDFVRWQRLVTVLTGLALVWVIMRLADRVSGPRVAVVAGTIAAVYPNLWVNDGLVMSESISMLLVALALWAGWTAVDDDRRSVAIGWGLALGLGVLSRSEVVFVAALLLVVVAVARHRAARRIVPVVIAAAVAGAVVAPWVVSNLTRFERPVVLSTNDGTTWAGSNCDAAYYSEVTGGWTILCVSNYPDTDPSVRSARYRADAFDYARQHLRRIPVVVAARIARTVDLYGFADMVRVDVGDERPEWVIWSGIASFWVLAPLAVFGWLRSRRRTRVVLAVPVVTVLLVAAAFYGGHRIRSSAEPALVVLAAVGAVAVWERVRRRSALGVAGQGGDE